MSDSPLIQTPSDPREATILERLLVLRNDLLLLRRDKSTYIKSQDVLPLYEDIVEQVHLLNEIRVEKPAEQNRGLLLKYRCRRKELYSCWQGKVDWLD